MQCLPKSGVLEFHLDTLEAVRRSCDLDRPGDMARAVDILEEWVQQQPHFTKKDFSREYLEIAIIGSKGSVERAKQRLDRICTFRTIMPQYFIDADLEIDFKEYHKCNVMGKGIIVLGGRKYFPLPKLTEEHYRVAILKPSADAKPTPHLILHFFITKIMSLEYIKLHDYAKGVVGVLDYLDVNFQDYLATLNISLIHQGVNIIIKGYESRVKAVYILSNSKLIKVLVGLLKQVVSPKIGSRIQVLDSKGDLQRFLPRGILPVEYGGEEKSTDLLFKEWIEELNSAKSRAYQREMTTARVDEARRPADSPRDHTGLGVPGTFRALSVD